MTLVIVGHNFEKISLTSWVHGRQDGNKKFDVLSDGLFAVADSSITVPGSKGSKAILGGFRKIYPIPIKVFKPHFTGLYFHSYLHVHFESECFVAFAGSTLTAQHVLNSITEHLSQLQIGYERNISGEGPGKYILSLHCQQNDLKRKQGVDQWDRDMFLPSDCDEVITADKISAMVEYCINEALSSARKYKLDKDSFDAMFTDFALGIFCPKRRSHELYVFRMKSKLNPEGVLEVYAEKEEIIMGKVGVLGMRQEFEERAQMLMRTLTHTGESPVQPFFSFINQAIDEVTAQGSTAIDRPSVCKVFREGFLEKRMHQAKNS